MAVSWQKVAEVCLRVARIAFMVWSVFKFLAELVIKTPEDSE